MRRKKSETPYNSTQYSQEPPINAKEHEDILVNLAFDLVEERLRNGSASSQETVHFLKLGSYKERLEIDKLEKEVELLRAKTIYLESQEQTNEKLQAVLDSMQLYSGGR